jgi:pimeloyl-ACP methyl ester carboxylesterase
MTSTQPTLLAQVDAQPSLGCALPLPGFVRYREKAASKPGLETCVLLHGIGSGSGSWVKLLTGALPNRMLAWDAPGYSDSNPLRSEQPGSQDYAQVLWAWLDELGVKEPVHLLGHSLGCIMAAGAAAQRPERVSRLTLLSPAQGYGTAPADVRERKTTERIQAVQELGLQAMAAQRAPRLLSPQAQPQEIELAVAMMGRLNPGGYFQATHLLGGADIRHDLKTAFAAQPALQQRTQVACGAQDIITPPAACQALANELNLPYTDLGAVGHLCALQASAAVSALLQPSMDTTHVNS